MAPPIHHIPEWKRCIGILVLFLVSNFLVRIAERRAWEVASTQREVPAPIIMHYHEAVVDIADPLGQWDGPNILDILTLVIPTTFFVRQIFTQSRLQMFREFMTLFYLTLFLRAGGLLCTVYPDSHQDCYLHKNEKTAWWVVMLNPAILPVLAQDTCGDMMPSGHTFFFFALGHSFSAHATKVEAILYWCLIATATVFIIVQRVHWTADVYMSILLSTMLWWLLVRKRQEKSLVGSALHFLTGSSTTDIEGEGHARDLDISTELPSMPVSFAQW